KGTSRISDRAAPESEPPSADILDVPFSAPAPSGAASPGVPFSLAVTSGASQLSAFSAAPDQDEQARSGGDREDKGEKPQRDPGVQERGRGSFAVLDTPV